MAPGRGHRHPRRDRPAIALLIPQTTPYAVAVGVGVGVGVGVTMHAAFSCLKPRQLITFSGLTVGSYLAYAS
ncbi:hypothetical protein ACIPSA_42340 [Streptomyces sp. NPDC086549]|uniref:hypothetical protein n=1 Tax=Streptomyces sp. NPDC086549 TaxID=3365752 RepID=UPI00381F8208